MRLGVLLVVALAFLAIGRPTFAEYVRPPISVTHHCKKSKPVFEVVVSRNDDVCGHVKKVLTATKGDRSVMEEREEFVKWRDYPTVTERNSPFQSASIEWVEADIFNSNENVILVRSSGGGSLQEIITGFTDKAWFNSGKWTKFLTYQDPHAIDISNGVTLTSKPDIGDEEIASLWDKSGASYKYNYYSMFASKDDTYMLVIGSQLAASFETFLILRFDPDRKPKGICYISSTCR